MSTDEDEGRPLVAWVEDDPEYQSIVREWLLPRYDLITYKDGGAFLDEMDEIEPALVILDVRLPGPDGFKLCRRIRAHKRLRSTPILFLTSSHEDVDYIKHLKVGGTEFLSKPVDRSELLSSLDELILKGAEAPL